MKIFPPNEESQASIESAETSQENSNATTDNSGVDFLGEVVEGAIELVGSLFDN